MATSLTNLVRKESKSYVEVYLAELNNPSYDKGENCLGLGLTVSRYFHLKTHYNQRWKSLRRLPPHLFFGLPSPQKRTLSGA